MVLKGHVDKIFVGGIGGGGGSLFFLNRLIVA
jgi:hypothetical protein